MRLIKAIVLGLILYALIFLDVSILMFVPILIGKAQLQSIIHLIILAIWSLICGYAYFKNQPGNIKEGFLVGIIMLLVGTVLDFTVTIPIFLLPKGIGFFDFYKSWSLWFGFVESLIIVTFSAKLFAKREKISKKK